jgi:hypothetical protein
VRHVIENSAGARLIVESHPWDAAEEARQASGTVDMDAVVLEGVDEDGNDVSFTRRDLGVPFTGLVLGVSTRILGSGPYGSNHAMVLNRDNLLELVTVLVQAANIRREEIFLDQTS